MKQDFLDPNTRSVVYKLLSQGFMYPDEERRRLIREGGWWQDLSGAISALDPVWRNRLQGTEWEPLARRQMASEGEEPAVDYVYLFDLGNGRPPCPPYGGLYQDAVERPVVLWELAEFYRAFGLEPGRGRELPDHVSMELEFMYFLAFKEAQAMAESEEPYLTGYRWAQRDFLERHLAAWFPRFARQVEEKSGTPFYTGLSRLTAEFLAWDLERLRAALGDRSLVAGGEAAGNDQYQQPAGNR